MANTQIFNLEGKVALITGASYGIGFAIATALAKAGAKIVFNDINQDLVNKGLLQILYHIHIFSHHHNVPVSIS